MTKDELIAYLEAVKAAETAKYFCEKMDAELSMQITAYADQPLPKVIDGFTFTPPKEPRKPKQLFDEINGPFTFVFACLILGSFLFLGKSNELIRLFLGIIMSVFSIPLGRLAAAIFKATPFYKREKKAEQDKRIAAVRDAAYAEWLATKTRNDAAIAAALESNRARAALRQVLTREQLYFLKRKARVQELLNSLYAKGIVYADFRNLAAVAQLLKYLKMGVCTQLEGTAQGYYIYLDDLRAEKIVGSVRQLEQTMIQGFSAILHNQAALVSVLTETRDQISGLADSLRADMDSLHRTVATGALATSASISHIASRTEALTTEWRDYVDRMERSATSYLRGR